MSSSTSSRCKEASHGLFLVECSTRSDPVQVVYLEAYNGDGIFEVFLDGRKLKKLLDFDNYIATRFDINMKGDKGNLNVLEKLASDVIRETVVDCLGRGLNQAAQCVVHKIWLEESRRVVERVREQVTVSALPSVRLEQPVTHNNTVLHGALVN